MKVAIKRSRCFRENLNFSTQSQADFENYWSAKNKHEKIYIYELKVHLNVGNLSSFRCLLEMWEVFSSNWLIDICFRLHQLCYYLAKHYFCRSSEYEFQSSISVEKACTEKHWVKQVWMEDWKEHIYLTHIINCFYRDTFKST